MSTRLHVALGCLAVLGCARDWSSFEPHEAATGTAGGAGTGGAGGMTGPGGGGAGGAGGGGPSDCGKLHLYRNEPAEAPGKWEIAPTSNISVDQGAGPVTFVIASTAGAEEAFFGSLQSASLLESSLSVELVDPPDATSYALLEADETKNTQNDLIIEVRSGALRSVVNLGPSQRILDSKPFDSTMHRFLRIRETGGTVFWETSPDGSAWVEEASEPTEALFPLHQLGFELAVGTTGTPAQPDTIIFDHVNAEAPPASWCPVEQLVDDFGGTVLGPAWRPVGGASLVSLTGSLHLAVTGNAIIDIQTASAFDFSASSVALEVLEPPGAGAAFELCARQSPSDQVIASVRDDQITYVDEMGVTRFAAAYDPVVHRWWRLRGAGQTLSFETAPDGVTWTEWSAHQTTLEVSRMVVMLSLDNDSAVVTHASVDNLNVLP